jgi:hypothetical protein
VYDDLICLQKWPIQAGVGPIWAFNAHPIFLHKNRSLMPRRSSKQTRNGAINSTGTESLRLAIKGKINKSLFNFYFLVLNLDFSIYDYSRSSKDSPRNNLRTKSKLTRECKNIPFSCIR